MTRATIAIAAGLGLVLIGSGGARAGELQYVGQKKCGTCHKKELMGDQMTPWRAGAHAKAFESLASEKAIEYARAAGIQGSPQEADACVKCHVTGHGLAAQRFKYKLDPADGVQCESCHGPGSGYRNKKVMSDHQASVAKGLVEQSAEVCTTCHNEESPAWDPERYVLANGSKTGFDYEQAKERIAHPIPPNVKGKYLELAEKEKAEK